MDYEEIKTSENQEESKGEKSNINQSLELDFIQIESQSNCIAPKPEEISAFDSQLEEKNLSMQVDHREEIKLTEFAHVIQPFIQVFAHFEPNNLANNAESTSIQEDLKKDIDPLIENIVEAEPVA